MPTFAISLETIPSESFSCRFKSVYFPIVLTQARVGNAEAQTETCGLLSTDGESMVTYYLGNNVEVVEQLLTADRFVAAIKPSPSVQHIAVFDITGMLEAIAPVKDASDVKFA